VPKIMKSCLNLSKLRRKFCQSLFSGHGVYMTSYLVMGKIMQTVLDNVDSFQFVIMRVIEYLILESNT